MSVPPTPQALELLKCLHPLSLPPETRKVKRASKNSSTSPILARKFQPPVLRRRLVHLQVARARFRAHRRRPLWPPAIPFPMLAQLDSLKTEALAALDTLSDEAALEAFRIDYLGKKGRLTALSAGMRDVPPDLKKEVGAKLNEVR